MPLDISKKVWYNISTIKIERKSLNMTDSGWYTFISHSHTFECYSRTISNGTVIEKYRVRKTRRLHYRAVLSNGKLLSITYIPEDERRAESYVYRPR